MGGFGEHYSIKGVGGDCEARRCEGGTLGNTDFLELAKKDATASRLSPGWPPVLHSHPCVVLPCVAPVLSCVTRAEVIVCHS